MYIICIYILLTINMCMYIVRTYYKNAMYIIRTCYKHCTYMYVLRNMWTLSVGFLWCVCDNYIAKTWNIFIVLRKVLFLEPKNKVYTYVGLSHVFYNTHENCYFSSTNKFCYIFNTLTIYVVLNNTFRKFLILCIWGS